MRKTNERLPILSANSLFIFARDTATFSDKKTRHETTFFPLRMNANFLPAGGSVQMEGARASSLHYTNGQQRINGQKFDLCLVVQNKSIHKKLKFAR